MSTKIETIKVVDAEGTEQALKLADYQKALLAEFNVKPLTIDESEIPATKIVQHVIKNTIADSDVDQAIKDAYPELVERVVENVAYTISNQEDAKQKAAAEKAKKEEEKAKKEEEKKAEALALAKTQETTLTAVSAGADAAALEFQADVEALAKNIPDGIRVVSKNGGYGLEFDKDATAETIGQSLGYFIQKSENSAFMGNQLQFWIGDIVNVLVDRGIYPTAKEAAKHINELLEKNHGKSLTTTNIDAYKRMASRVPVELRNPQVQPTAYLAVANIPQLKKDNKETLEDFKKRETAFEADRVELLGRLAKGEVTNRKDILTPVEDVLIKHGLKEKKEESNQPSVGALLQQFFHTTVGLEALLNVHGEDSGAVYAKGENKYTLSEQELTEKRDEAYSALVNLLYTNKAGHTIKDFARGYVIKKIKVEEAKDADGKPIFGEQETEIPVFPQPFFSVEAPATEESPAA